VDYNKSAPNIIIEINNNNQCCLYIRSQYTNTFCTSRVFSIAIVHIQKSSLKVKRLENEGHVLSSGIFISVRTQDNQFSSHLERKWRLIHCS